MRIRPLLAACLAAVSLTACGATTAPSGSPFSASPSPNGEAAKKGPEVAKDAAAALLEAGAATVSGSLTVDGEDLRIDLHLQGADLTGTVETGGSAVEVIDTNGVVYAKTQAAFWAAHGIPAPVAARLDGRWVVVPDPLAGELTPVSLPSLADRLRDPPGNATIEDAVRVDTVHGHDLEKVSGDPVVVLTVTDGTTIDVAATGTPYPLLIARPDDRSDPLTFSAFDEREAIATPSSALDLAQELTRS